MTEKYYIDNNGTNYYMTPEDAETFDDLTEVIQPKPSEEHIYSKENDGWEIPADPVLTQEEQERIDHENFLESLPARVQTLESRIAELESVEVVVGIANPITTAGEYSIVVDNYSNEWSQWSKWDQMHVYFSANEDFVDHHVATYDLKDFASYDGSTNGWMTPTNARYVTHNVGGYLIARVPGNDYKLKVVMLSAGSIQKIKFSKR